MTDVFQRRFDQFLFKGIDPEDAILPNFSDIVTAAAHLSDVFEIEQEENAVATRRVLHLFRAILQQQFHLNPILLEIAAVKDERELRTSIVRPDHRSFFVSYVACYLPEAEAKALLRAWDQSIRRLTSANAAIVPNPETYLSVDHRVPLKAYAEAAFLLRHKLKDFPEWPGDDKIDDALLETIPVRQLERFLPQPFCLSDQQPGLTLRRRYDFEAHEATSNDDVKLAIKELARGTLYELLLAQQDEYAVAITQKLAASQLIVVPFRRQIHFPFARPDDGESHRRFGANPGGCLIAIVSLTPELEMNLALRDRERWDNPSKLNHHFELATECISWLAQQAALLEGDATSQIERQVGQEIVQRLEFTRHLVVNSYEEADYWLDGLREVLPHNPAIEQNFRRASASIDNLVCLNECAIKRERRLLKFVKLSVLLRHLRAAYFTDNDLSPSLGDDTLAPEYAPAFTRDIYMLLANLVDNARNVADQANGEVGLGYYRVPGSNHIVVWVENTGDPPMPPHCQAYLRGESVIAPRRENGSEPFGLRTVVSILKENGLPSAFVASPFTLQDARARLKAVGLDSVTQFTTVAGKEMTKTRIEISIPQWLEVPSDGDAQ